ncbi:MAG: lipoate--protein ligase family protein [Oligosphaeraceae bacterium]|nr:lipoate--protein ligase family protein [Oligosphaeraceae bacterium]
MQVFISPYHDAISNAALEESLFRLRPLRRFLFFYVNTEETVLWGRNQNPYLECALDLCRDEGISLLRRISGGGTVFHDSGNLNYVLIMERCHWDASSFLQLVVQGLEDCGLSDIRACERHSIWQAGHKVSGSAFAQSGPALLWHGCILLQSDLSRLWRFLTPQAETVPDATATPRSLRSPVANLGLPAAQLQSAIVERFSAKLQCNPEWIAYEYLPIDTATLQIYREKFAAPEWTFALAKK